MEIVIDTNIFLAVALNEPNKQKIIKITANAQAIAPEILPYEIGNALSVMYKRKQVSSVDALKAEAISNSIPVRLVSVDIEASLAIALANNMYAYDAYFLQCALSVSQPLLTLDLRLRKIARKLNINVLEI
jgi:predicted nucleic acid-binding protein